MDKTAYCDLCTSFELTWTKLLSVIFVPASTKLLTVNMDKTEVLVFSRSRVGVKAVVHFGQQMVPQNTQYKYLGIIFTTTQGAKSGGEALWDTARKAMFALEKQIRVDNITNPLTAFHLFDALVAPILLYGSGIWGCYGKAAEVDTQHIVLSGGVKYV
jgi:hypothetical protein